MASGFGRRAEIPILPIFDLVPPPRLPTKTEFFFKTPSHRRRMEHEVDSWIAQLSQCKQLSEADVKTLCDRVRISFIPPPHANDGLILSSPFSLPLSFLFSPSRPGRS